MEFFRNQDAKNAIKTYNNAELNGQMLKVEFEGKRKQDIGKRFKRIPKITY